MKRSFEHLIKLTGSLSCMDGQSRTRAVPCDEAVVELLTLGFDALLRERYERHQRGEISFGRLAREVTITAWELSYLLEEGGWAAHNLPSSA